MSKHTDVGILFLLLSLPTLLAGRTTFYPEFTQSLPTTALATIQQCISPVRVFHLHDALSAQHGRGLHVPNT